MAERTQLDFEVQGSEPAHQDMVDRIVSVTEYLGLASGYLGGDSCGRDARFYQTAELAARIAVALLDHSGSINNIPQNEEMWGEDSHVGIIAKMIEDGTIDAYNLARTNASRTAHYNREFSNVFNVEPGSPFGYPNADSDSYAEQMRSEKRRKIVDPDGVMTEDEYDGTFMGSCDEDEYSEKYYEIDGNLYFDGRIHDEADKKAQLAKLAGWIKLRSEEKAPDSVVVPTSDDPSAIRKLHEISRELRKQHFVELYERSGMEAITGGAEAIN